MERRAVRSIKPPRNRRQKTNGFRHANSESSYCYRSKIMLADEEPRRHWSLVE
jgi:hypothetical protein